MSDQPLDQSDPDDPKPWTIKSVPHEARNAAIAAAKRDKVFLGEWLGRAITQKIKADRQADRAPITLSQPELAMVRPSDREADIDQIERLAAVLAQTALATQRPLPRTMAALINKKVRDHLLAKSGPTIAMPQSDPPPAETDLAA